MCVCVRVSACAIPGSFDMQFDLQVGVGTLVVAKPLDAEVQSVFNMTVQVTDGTNFATAQVYAQFVICNALALLPEQIKLLLHLPGGRERFFFSQLCPSLCLHSPFFSQTTSRCL